MAQNLKRGNLGVFGQGDGPVDSGMPNYVDGRVISDLTYELSKHDNNATLLFTAGATVTVPHDLEQGLTVAIVQLGAGTVTVIAAGGVSVLNRQSHTGTAGQYAYVAVVGITANAYLLIGDTG